MRIARLPSTAMPDGSSSRSEPSKEFVAILVAEVLSLLACA